MSPTKEADYSIYTKGYNMMVKMGFKKGEGLGVHNQGMTAPIIPRNITSMEQIGSPKRKIDKIEKRDEIFELFGDLDNRFERPESSSLPPPSQKRHFAKPTQREKKEKPIYELVDSKKKDKYYEFESKKKEKPSYEFVDLCTPDYPRPFVDIPRPNPTQKRPSELAHNPNLIIDLTESNNEKTKDEKIKDEKAKDTKITEKYLSELCVEKQALETQIKEEERKVAAHKELLEKILQCEERIKRGEINVDEARGEIEKLKQNSEKRS